MQKTLTLIQSNGILGSFATILWNIVEIFEEDKNFSWDNVSVYWNLKHYDVCIVYVHLKHNSFDTRGFIMRMF